MPHDRPLPDGRRRRASAWCRSTASLRAVVALGAVLLSASARAASACVGDCDGDGTVALHELVLGVDIALRPEHLADCPDLDRSGNDAVEIDELTASVRAAMRGCAVATPTPTPTPTDPRAPFCATANAVRTPKPPAPCVPTPGMFTDCFATSGLDFEHYDEGENGAAAADVDGDGFPDLLFWNMDGGAGLFLNRGDAMQFERVADSPLVWVGHTTVVAAVFGDLDNDGNTDLVVSVDKTVAAYFCDDGGRVDALHVYRNRGDGDFEEVTEAWGFGHVLTERSDKPLRVGLVLADLNLDGRLDVVEYGRGLDLRPLAFLSRPGGTTWEEAGRDVFGDARGLTFTLHFTDWNRDQLLDVFVVNDYHEEVPAKYLQRVDRSLSYVPGELAPTFGATPHGSPMGAATADLNGDGELDLVVSDTGDQHVWSLGTDVAGEWNVKQSPGRFGLPQNCWSIGVVDLENDARPDLFFACAGFRVGSLDRAASFVLRNVGGAFELATGLLPGEESVTWEEGLALADFDQDGRLDLLTGGLGERPRLLWNRIPGGSALALRLKGRTANAEGIGARVTVEAAGLPTQVREMFPGGGTWGYSDTQLLFGLGDATRATVTVDWRPAGGEAVQSVELGAGKALIEEP